MEFGLKSYNWINYQANSFRLELNFLGFFLAFFSFLSASGQNIQLNDQQVPAKRQLYATDDALCQPGSAIINVDNSLQLIFGITHGNFLGPNAFKSTTQVCFDLQTALAIMEKYKLAAPGVSVDSLTTVKVLNWAGAANSTPDLQKFVLGCELLKHFNDGVLGNTSMDLRDENCRYLKKIASACGELFGDTRFDQGPSNYKDLLVCNVGGSIANPNNPLPSGPGAMCAHSDGLCATHETYVNFKDSPLVLGIDFINTPFSDKTFDTLNQVCFDLNTTKTVIKKYNIVTPVLVVDQLTQNSPELQKFLFGCEFLKRNPKIIAPWDLVVRDTLCEYEKVIAPACAELYCNPEFKTVAEGMICHNGGIGQLPPRPRPYPAFTPVGLAAQLPTAQPQWHAAGAVI